MDDPGSQTFRRVRAAALLGVGLVALTELVAVVWGASRPSLRVSQAAPLQAAASPMVQGSTLLAAAPPHLAGPLFGLLGTAAPREAPAFVDSARFDSALHLAVGGAQDPALKSWGLQQQAEVGRVRLRLLRNPSPVPVRFDLVAHLLAPELHVSHGPAGSTGVACGFVNAVEAELPAGSAVPWAPKARFSCAADPRAFVAAVVMEDARGTARRCIWTFPTTNAVRLAWTQVPAGAGIRGGVAMPSSPTGNGTARLRFKVNGGVVGELPVDASARFDSFDLPAAGLAEGGEVVLEVEQLSEHLAPVCVEASVR
jgi:hypothetical protein